ncbi:hypothetical protein [Lentimicrobium sp. S6]|uniref:hypothetical protein n=1 Tax=Lentimicrobium sp. S6 TaxID=2735872 RepID=UPI0015553BA4|nr:hypothetical protein [Lentimicrobium sp. S6]NPD44660.1 hypothetical protein [Lentimicrobium sp. S6]
MNNTLEKRSLNKSKSKSVIELKKEQKIINSKDKFVLDKPTSLNSKILGLKITRAVFQNKEYIVKANRYAILMILQHLLDNNKIDLKEELPLKINKSNSRCILNDKPSHPNNYKMRDIHILKTINDKLYAETKLDTHTIHNGCYSLLYRYSIPIESLKIEYSKKRTKAGSQYKEALKTKGYCEIDNLKTTKSKIII